MSRVDTKVDRRLDESGGPEARDLRGTAAIANAMPAYQLFVSSFQSERWARLRDLGAAVQRPLWASTSPKDPDYRDTLYVDSLIGPDTVSTMPEATLEAVEDHGTLERTLDDDPDAPRQTLERLEHAGIDMEDVASILEDEGVAAFAESYDELLAALDTKAQQLRGQP